MQQIAEKMESADADAQIARGLGWFSIGLGLAEVIAPRAVAAIAGIEPKNCGLIRLFGLREIAHGVGIFAQGKQPSGAVWSRTVGDALDLAALGLAMVSPSSNKTRLAIATANVLAITALDIVTATKLSKKDGTLTENGSITVRHSIFINRPPEELYRYWQNFEQLPTFMEHLVSVTMKPDGRSHWVAKAPAGTTVSWDAEIVEDRPNELIAWKSLPGSLVPNSGSVRFEQAPGHRGTYVRVQIEYQPPGSVIGAGVAKLFREDPRSQLKDDLRRFKQIIEVGEVVRSDANPIGNGKLIQRPARPVSEPTPNGNGIPELATSTNS